MKLVSVSGWSRDKVKSEKLYLEWVSSVNEGDLVALQQFYPYNKSLMGYGFECWQFQCVRVNKRSVSPGFSSGEQPINRGNGTAVYWGSDTEWGEVFPARIVPLSSDLLLNECGDKVISDRPVYEPLFTSATRHLYLVPRRPYSVTQAIREVYPRNYCFESHQGMVFHCFSGDWNPKEIDGAKHLYSIEAEN